MSRFGFFYAVALLGAACATPVGVTRVDTQTSYHLLTSSAVASGQVSENTKRILRRYLLQDLFEKNPGEALATLHRGFVRDGEEDRLTTLAELSFLHAEKTRERSHYLAAAVYAYALLFPGEIRRILLEHAGIRCGEQIGREEVKHSMGVGMVKWGVTAVLASTALVRSVVGQELPLRKAEITKLTCEEFAAVPHRQVQTDILIYMNGYLDGIGKATVWDAELVGKCLDEVVRLCAANPKSTLFDAFKQAWTR